jgi:hypothetical protein
VQKSKLLDDVFYDKQIERMSSLAKFPQVPEAKKELRRALRRISETNVGFISRLISDVIDTNEKCPTPAELIRRAGDMRQLAPKSHGKPDCERCHGTGWVSFTRRVSVNGVAPYDADAAKACDCIAGQ